MSEDKPKLSGPDLTQAIELSTIPDGTMLLGHARGEPVLLARRGDEVFAIGAICTHYGAPLEQGLLVGDTVRCPWHHACFSLRTGEALRAPAVDPVSRWRVEAVRDVARQFTPVDRQSAPCSSGKSWNVGTRRHTLHRKPCRNPSSSSAVVGRVTPRPRCCGAKPIRVGSRC